MDSNFVEIFSLLDGLPTTDEQNMGCLFLESKGLKFCVDYGYDNAVEKCQSFADWQTPGKA